MHEFARFMFEKGYALFVAYEPVREDGSLREEPWFVSWNPDDDREPVISRGIDPYEAFIKACRATVQIEIVGRN